MRYICLRGAHLLLPPDHDPISAALSCSWASGAHPMSIVQRRQLIMIAMCDHASVRDACCLSMPMK